MSDLRAAWAEYDAAWAEVELARRDGSDIRPALVRLDAAEAALGLPAIPCGERWFRELPSKDR